MFNIIKSSKIIDLCGWVGTSALIVAYLFASFNIVDATGLGYQILNLAGSLGLIVVAVSKKAEQLVVLNIFWALIGILSLIRIFI